MQSPSLHRVSSHLHVGDLAVGDKDARVLELAELGLLVLDEVGADETAVDLHALSEVDLVRQRLKIKWSSTD